MQAQDMPPKAEVSAKTEEEFRGFARRLRRI
jgi:hypothetical protein